jgi:tetratricopeptide (TPR) repeat protein
MSAGRGGAARGARLALGCAAALLLVASALLTAASPRAATPTTCRQGAAAQEAGDSTRAIELLDRCLREERLSAGETAYAYFKRGRAHSDAGDHDRAIRDFDHAIQYDAADVNAYNFRGLAYEDKRQYAAAIADFERAIELDPDFEAPHNNLAWLLATGPQAALRDGRRAVMLAERATALLPNEAMYLDTLAAAYAEAGRFADAVRTQEAAIALLHRHGRMGKVPDYTARLEAYRQNRAWRQ